MRFINKNFVVCVGILVALLALLSVYISNNQILPAYIEELSTAEPTTEVSIDAQDYKNHLGFSLKIPFDWTKAEKNANDVFFLDKHYGTSLEIMCSDYNPNITSMTYEKAHAEKSTSSEFLNFYWNDGHSYSITYKSENDDNIYNCVDVVYFDRKNIVKLVFMIPNDNYKKVEKEVGYVIDSIEWDSENAIPDTFRLNYSEFGNFEYGVPLNWSSGFAENAFYAQDENTKAQMVVTAFKSDIIYSDVSQIDYVKIASESRKGFALRNYTANDNIIYASAAYLNGQEKYIVVQYLIATGKYEYSITFDYPAAQQEIVAPFIDNALTLFRCF